MSERERGHTSASARHPLGETAPERWFGRARRVAFVILGLLLLGYIAAYVATYSDRAQRIRPEIWDARDPSLVARGWRLLGMVEEARPAGETAGAALALPPTPPAVATLAARWVDEVNRLEPATVLWFDADARGNLYILAGGWWYASTPDGQMVSLDRLSMSWRHYLRTVLASWDTREGFDPGIVVVDVSDDGEVVMLGSSIDGRIAIFDRSTVDLPN